MHGCLGILIGASLWAFPPVAYAQDPPAPPPQPPATVREITGGTKELSEKEVRRAVSVEIGQPLPDTPEHLAEGVVRRYQDDGYSFAHATGTFDAATGTLKITVDEGVIDRVEFQGVGPKVARTFADEFALRAGDVFNRKRAMQALDVLLRQTRGAIRRRASTSGQPRPPQPRGEFDLIDRTAQRVLLVGP
jgi:hemolysin activation/secretion protein